MTLAGEIKAPIRHADRFFIGGQWPPLILVTTGSSGDLVVLEGHARLTAFMLCPDRLPPELEVLVGSSSAMADWGLW